MAYLIVRDTDGKEILTRELASDESYTYQQAYQARESVPFDGKLYKLHSVARTRPEQNVILCVSFDRWEPSHDPYGC